MRVEAVLAGVGHSLEVRVERAGVSFAGVVTSHLACNREVSVNGEIRGRCNRLFQIFFASDFFVRARSWGREDWAGLMPFTLRGGGGGGGGDGFWGQPIRLG